MTLYTTQQVADLLDLHVKTVRAYVKAGRLRSTRIGKQYRIARKDLEAFLGKPLDASPARVTSRAEVSSIVELDGIGNDAASRLANLMMTAAQGHRDEAPLRVETLFDTERNRLKLIIIGSLDATVTLLQMIERLSRES